MPLILVAIAVLGAISALWTLAPLERTLIWALTVAGYAAVAVSAACAARLLGVELLAGAIAVIASAAAVTGLAATLLHEAPYAQPVAGAWRPAGPFEYSPALALLQVSALPALLTGVGHPAWLVKAAAVIGLALAAAVLALSASRIGLAMAVAVVGLALAFRAPSPRWRLPAAAKLAAIAVAALAAGALAFGTDAGRGAGPPTDFLHGRTSTWNAGLEAFADRPWTGAGADGFLVASARHQDGQTIRFAHQLPLELGVELGVAGLALALALYAATLAALWRTRRTRAARLLGPAVAAFLIASLVDWPWHLAGAGAVWALAVGALAGEETRRWARMPPRHPQPRKDPCPDSDGWQSPSPARL